MSLRPIGTEFWYQFPIPMGSTQSYASRFLYRVVRHTKGMTQTRSVELIEEIEPLEMKEIYPESCKICECGCGKLVYQFPAEPARQKDSP